MMGGTVTLSSVLGKGTLLKICIPFEKTPISDSNTDLSVTAAETSRRTDVLYRRREEIRILLAEGKFYSAPRPTEKRLLMSPFR